MKNSDLKTTEHLWEDIQKMTSIDSYLQEVLNEQQYNAASYVTWHSLILAWAWSGKTRTLTYKIANLIHAHWVHPSEILAVTFTNKAAKEMKERLQHIIQELATDWSNATYAPWDYKWIWTFHWVFLKLLKQDIDKLWKAYTTSFTIYDSWDSASVLKKLLKEKDLADRVEFREASRLISGWKNKWRLPEQAALHCETQLQERVSLLYKAYQKTLEDSNALDFDDLLLQTKVLFDAQPDVSKKRQDSFKHILVDEAQDTNAIQFSLMRQLVSPTATITFIGDDYQSIYRRRWAVMDNFLNVDKRWPEIKTFKLEMNYRSKPHIVDAWNAIIKNNNKQYEKEVKPHRDGNDFIRMFTFADEIDEATQIVDLITKLKEENDKTRSDFTVLYRTNAQSSPFEQILLTEWIPYTVVWAFKFFERSEIKDMVAYVKYVLNPKDTVALQRIINVPNRKIWKTSIEQLEETARWHFVTFNDVVQSIDKYWAWLKPAVQTKIRQFSTIMHSIISMVEMTNPWQLLDQLVKWTQYEQRVVKTDGKERAQERMDNIGQLINIAHKYEAVGRESLVQFLEEISLMTSLEDSADETPQAVRLMSVHASKWLEFPYVFIVWLEEWVFPLPKAKFDDAELEEERRWMYVAITRAKDHLFMSHAQSRLQRWQIKYNPPSRFLEEVPSELVKRYDMWGQSTRQVGKSRDEGDLIHHKLFWDWEIIEVWSNVVIVRFNNPKFWVRKMEGKWLKAA